MIAGITRFRGGVEEQNLVLYWKQTKKDLLMIAICMIACAKFFAAALTVQVAADPNGPLEPSIINEVDHALSRVPVDAACAVSTATNSVALGDIFSTNGLSMSDIAIQLVSRQDSSGRWIVNGTNATAEAVAILVSLTDAGAVVGAGPNSSTSEGATRLGAEEFCRIDRLWNMGWRFRMEDGRADVSRYANPAFDDSGWRVVDAPHDYGFEIPWNRNASPLVGFKPLVGGWYRKRFTPEDSWKGRKVMIEFEGLMAVADVFLNGEKVASTEYGYLGACADIGDRLKWGEKNVVAVRCDPGRPNGSRWYPGAGMVRDVHLVVKSPVSINRHGLYVTADAEGNVKAVVQLDGYRCQGRANRLDVIVDAFDSDGRRVARTTAVAPWSKKANQEVALPAVKVDSPELWEPDRPALYTAVATLVLNGEVVDDAKTRFGFRSIAYGPEFGFRLNGKKLWIKGMANHADYGAVGCAAYDRAIRRQFEMMKRFGFNAVRCSHNPYSPGMLRLADEMGILVIDEIADKWGDTNYWIGRVKFTDIWDELITEWIKRDRNHPSVILWSLGNELQMREDLAGFKTDDWAVTTYRVFDVVAKRWDATRPTTVAMFPALKGSVTKRDVGFRDQNPEPPELSLVTEVASYNYLYQNYASYKRQHPGLVVFQSEASVRDLQRPVVAMDRSTTVGLCYWGAIEYWGESDGWPKKGWNYSFFSHTLEPHPTAYLVKSLFSDEPVVRIGVVKGVEASGIEWNDIQVGSVSAVEDWNLEAGAKVLVYTYTNADEVELQVNGRTIGVKRNRRDDKDCANAIRWADVPYAAGRVTAIARNAGREVARHEIATAGAAARLKVMCENRGDWKGDGLDLQYVRVYAVDNVGRRVRSAAQSVSFDVAGPATLIAVDNGDHCTDELFHNVRSKNMKDGFVMGIFRSRPEKGPVTITVSSDGLPSETVMLDLR